MEVLVVEQFVKPFKEFWAHDTVVGCAVGVDSGYLGFSGKGVECVDVGGVEDFVDAASGRVSGVQ